MEAEEEQPGGYVEARGTRKPWIPMSGRYLGRIGDLVLGGGGKPMTSTGDPGEPVRKPSGEPG